MGGLFLAKILVAIDHILSVVRASVVTGATVPRTLARLNLHTFVLGY